MRNVETPMRSGLDENPTSKPTAREAQILSGKGRSKKRTPPAERHEEYITRWIEPRAKPKGIEQYAIGQASWRHSR
jgi:hypothetical protein